eukprot:g2752.t1
MVMRRSRFAELSAHYDQLEEAVASLDARAETVQRALQRRSTITPTETIEIERSGSYSAKQQSLRRKIAAAKERLHGFLHKSSLKSARKVCKELLDAGIIEAIHNQADVLHDIFQSFSSSGDARKLVNALQSMFVHVLQAEQLEAMKISLKQSGAIDRLNGSAIGQLHLIFDLVNFLYLVRLQQARDAMAIAHDSEVEIMQLKHEQQNLSPPSRRQRAALRKVVRKKEEQYIPVKPVPDPLHEREAVLEQYASLVKAMKGLVDISHEDMIAWWLYRKQLRISDKEHADVLQRLDLTEEEFEASINSRRDIEDSNAAFVLFEEDEQDESDEERHRRLELYFTTTLAPVLVNAREIFENLVQSGIIKALQTFQEDMTMICERHVLEKIDGDDMESTGRLLQHAVEHLVECQLTKITCEQATLLLRAFSDVRAKDLTAEQTNALQIIFNLVCIVERAVKL